MLGATAPPPPLPGAARGGAARGLQGDGASGIRVDDCMKLLGGKSDEEKFAGLLLVTKAVRSDDLDVMRRVMQAVGMAFVCRLLSSPGSPGDASDGSCLYQNLALHLLTAFLSLEELALEIQTDKSFLKIAKLLLGIMTVKDNVTSSGNALVCMASLAATPDGGKRLRASGAIEQLLGWLEEQTEAPSSGDSEHESNRQKAWHVLECLLEPTAAPEVVAKAVPTMARLMAEGPGIMKLEVLPRLAGVMACMEPPFAEAIQVASLASASLRTSHAPQRWTPPVCDRQSNPVEYS